MDRRSFCLSPLIAAVCTWFGMGQSDAKSCSAVTPAPDLLDYYKKLDARIKARGVSEDERAIRWAREHCDMSKNLNDQGYYGPFPNDADPRLDNTGAQTPEVVEYYSWVGAWIAEHGRFDNAQMFHDRLAWLRAKYPGRGWTLQV